MFIPLVLDFSKWKW